MALVDVIKDFRATTPLAGNVTLVGVYVQLEANYNYTTDQIVKQSGGMIKQTEWLDSLKKGELTFLQKAGIGFDPETDFKPTLEEDRADSKVDTLGYKYLNWDPTKQTSLPLKIIQYDIKAYNYFAVLGQYNPCLFRLVLTDLSNTIIADDSKEGFNIYQGRKIIDLKHCHCKMDSDAPNQSSDSIEVTVTGINALAMDAMKDFIV